MTKIIIDSNALFIPLRFKLDLMEELSKILNKNFEVAILSPVKDELQMLSSKGKTKKTKEAAFALRLSQNFKTIPVEQGKNETVDDVIVRFSNEFNMAVFTNDKILRKRLRDISVPVIYLREKSRLDIDGKI